MLRIDNINVERFPSVVQLPRPVNSEKEQPGSPQNRIPYKEFKIIFIPKGFLKILHYLIMAKEKELKLLAVQKHNPALYEKVMNGEMSIHDAYNETQRVQLGLTEFRGTNTKKKEFGVDFKRIIRLHDPTLENVIAEIKKQFPLTWKEFIKE